MNNLSNWITDIRQLIQDLPQEALDVFVTDGETRVFQLLEYPVLKDSTELILNNNIVEDGFILGLKNGRLTFFEPPETGNLLVKYEYAQLSNEEIALCVSNAVVRHDESTSLDNIPTNYIPYIQLLAASSAFYMLASKWAIKYRTKVETIEEHEHQVGNKYFELGKRMEESYNLASAGIIDVKTVTRRDVRTGRLTALPEDVYDE